MFKRKETNGGKTTCFTFGCRVFYTHIANVIIMFVVAILVNNLTLLKIEPSDDLYSILVTAVCFVFYVAYVYVQSWRVGQRDRNLAEFGRITYDRWKPLYAALVSQAVGIILVVMVLVTKGAFTWVRYARYYYINFNWFLLKLGDSFPPVYIVPILIPLLLVPAAYHLGYRDIYLRNKIMFQQPQAGQKDRDFGKRA